MNGLNIRELEIDGVREEEMRSYLTIGDALQMARTLGTPLDYKTIREVKGDAGIAENLAIYVENPSTMDDEAVAIISSSRNKANRRGGSGIISQLNN